MKPDKELIQKVDFFYETSKRMGHTTSRQTIRNRIIAWYNEQEILYNWNLQDFKKHRKKATLQEYYSIHTSIYWNKALSKATFTQRITRHWYTIEEAIYTPSHWKWWARRDWLKRLTKEMYLKNQIK